MSAKAFAPATVANVNVGFDILGFSVEGIGDTVEVSILSKQEVEILEITGVVANLPKDPNKNTATVALKKMITDLKLDHGFSLKINKGIPLSSGMGGSAASAVAAVVAANALLKNFLTTNQLLEFALAGEAVASGAIHGDNVGPCLFGGLTLILPTNPMEMISIPVPKDLFCVLVHPELKVETKHARSILKKEITLHQHAEQSAYLAGFLAGCFKQDLNLISKSMKDLFIGPQRSSMITGFSDLQKKAEELKALGFGISGSGPSVFAWCKDKTSAEKLNAELIKIFKSHGTESFGIVSPVQSLGARIIK